MNFSFKNFLLVFLMITVCSLEAIHPIEAAESQVAAQVGESTITIKEVEDAAGNALAGLKSELYNIRRQYLTRLIHDELLELEALKRGVSKDQLKEEVRAQAEPVTEEDIQNYYEKYKDRLPEEKTEEVRKTVHEYLAQQKERNALKLFLSDLRDKYPVEIQLLPPRFEITVPENALSRGPNDAPVTIIEYSDFQCPYCKKSTKVITKLLQKYPGKIRIVYRDFPLSFHKNAEGAAVAARCANEQGSFWQYHDILFSNQKALGRENLKKYAAGLALNSEQFNQCLDENRYLKDVRADFSSGDALGVSGTPAFFVNGRPLQGAQPLQSFIEIIDEELQGNE